MSNNRKRTRGRIIQAIKVPTYVLRTGKQDGTGNYIICEGGKVVTPQELYQLYLNQLKDNA